MATWAQAAAVHPLHQMAPIVGATLGLGGAQLEGKGWPRLGGAVGRVGRFAMNNPRGFAVAGTLSMVGATFGTARLTGSRPEGASKVEGTLIGMSMGGGAGALAGMVGGIKSGIGKGRSRGVGGAMIGVGVGAAVGGFLGYKGGGWFGRSFRDRGVGYYLPMAGLAGAMAGGARMGYTGGPLGKMFGTGSLGWKGAVAGTAYSIPGVAAAAYGLYGHNRLKSNRHRA